MRDIIKNPMLYYILAPVLVGLWPTIVWWYMPKAEKALEADQSEYVKATNAMVEILTLDPGRLEGQEKNRGTGVFSYGEAVSRVADRCQIGSRNHRCIAGPRANIGGKEIQPANVTLTDVGIVQTCTFLSTIQSMWVNLECESVDLKKKEGGPDRWDVGLSFKYTY